MNRRRLPVLKAALIGWTTAKPYARIALPIISEVAGGQHKINTPDKANATCTPGLLFPLRDNDPDYPALLMDNHYTLRV